MRKAFVGIIVLGVIMVLLGATPGHGQPRPRLGSKGMLGDGPGMLLRPVLWGVKLTDEQQAQVRTIMAGHRETLRTLFVQLRGAHEALADKLFGEGEVQAEELTPLVGQITQLREQLLREGLKVVLEVRGVLTPEQRVRATSIKDQMRALRAQMRGLLTGLE